MLRRRLLQICPWLLISALAFGVKDEPQVLVWPQNGSPVLRFSFAKFKEIGSAGRQKSLVAQTTAQNLWDRKITRAGFTVYVFDKDKVRIGQSYIVLDNLQPGETTKFQIHMAASGTPVSLELVAEEVPAELKPKTPVAPKTISITVNSVPQGANLKVDGNDAGTTPRVIHVTAGRHELEFSKEGFNPGKFPFELGPDDASGGSVSYELGASAHDTLELRDGSVLTCDVESVTATEVVIRMGGALQRFERNKVKRIGLVERDPPSH
jgi:PEGA domain